MIDVDATHLDAGIDAGGEPRPLLITRDFRASRDRVWQAWTQPDALIRWHGPSFYRAAEITADVRVGGAWRACLKSDNVDDVVLWQSGRYLVVTPPERLEFTFAWETPDHEDGPGIETHVIVRLEALADGGTRMHFSQTGFLSSKSALSHSTGWNGTFDRLEPFYSASWPGTRAKTQTLRQSTQISSSETEALRGQGARQRFCSIHRRLWRRPRPEPGTSARQGWSGIAQLVLPD